MLGAMTSVPLPVGDIFMMCLIAVAVLAVDDRLCMPGVAWS